MLGCSLLQTPPAGSWLSLRLSRAGLLTRAGIQPGDEVRTGAPQSGPKLASAYRQ